MAEINKRNIAMIAVVNLLIFTLVSINIDIANAEANGLDLTNNTQAASVLTLLETRIDEQSNTTSTAGTIESTELSQPKPLDTIIDGIERMINVVTMMGKLGWLILKSQFPILTIAAKINSGITSTLMQSLVTFFVGMWQIMLWIGYLKFGFGSSRVE